uniref:Uncharacterized protein n=1 Tax=Fagus sylvatica TaxID=28930 RepID=A0A2N9JB35_FAGSY
MVELRAAAADDDGALAFGFDPGNDLALGHGGAESRHEDLPDLRSNRRGCLESRFKQIRARVPPRGEAVRERCLESRSKQIRARVPPRGEAVRERRGTAGGGRRCERDAGGRRGEAVMHGQ